MNYTSIEQIKKLLELELNPESADIVFRFAEYYGEYLPIVGNGFSTSDIPCWSVGSLTELIPAYVIEKHPLSDKIVVWSCGLNS